MKNEWIVSGGNAYGYTGFTRVTPSAETNLVLPEVVKKSFVIDYGAKVPNPLMEYEEEGFEYRYTYGAGQKRLSDGVFYNEP